MPTGARVRDKFHPCSSGRAINQPERPVVPHVEGARELLAHRSITDLALARLRQNQARSRLRGDGALRRHGSGCSVISYMLTAEAVRPHHQAEDTDGWSTGRMVLQQPR